MKSVEELEAMAGITYEPEEEKEIDFGEEKGEGEGEGKDGFDFPEWDQRK